MCKLKICLFYNSDIKIVCNIFVIVAATLMCVFFLSILTVTAADCADETQCSNYHETVTPVEHFLIPIPPPPPPIMYIPVPPMPAADSESVYFGTGFFSFMSYRTITSRNSRQFRMRESAVTGNDGLRRYNDLIKVAIGTGWGFDVGDQITIYLDSGITIEAIVGDIKNNRHTCYLNKVSIHNGCALEFIVDRARICEVARQMGDMSFAGFEGRVTNIVSK